MEQSGKNFSMVRGDTENLVVSIEVEGVATPLVTGDTVYFTMTKKGATRLETLATTPYLTKTITSFTDGLADIPFAHEDTADIVIDGEDGFNEYDIEVKAVFADGDQKTAMLAGTLKVYGGKSV